MEAHIDYIIPNLSQLEEIYRDFPSENRGRIERVAVEQAAEFLKDNETGVSLAVYRECVDFCILAQLLALDKSLSHQARCLKAFGLASNNTASIAPSFVPTFDFNP